jgi:hypothetical protein
LPVEYRGSDSPREFGGRPGGFMLKTKFQLIELIQDP